MAGPSLNSTMGCFNGYVGLRYCSFEAPEVFSDMFVNDVPGISLEFLDHIADEEQKTFLGVWANVNTTAEPKFIEQAYLIFKRCWKVKNRTCVSDLLCENIEEFSRAWQYFLASELLIFRMFSSRTNAWTISDEEAEKLLEYTDSEWKQALEIAINGLDITPCENSECFECSGDRVTYDTILP